MYTGTLRYNDIGAGGWSLETEDGTVYSLSGTIPEHLRDKKVALKAKPMHGMGFMMSGPILKVEEIDEI